MDVGVTVMCTRHKRKVHRRGSRILHTSPGSSDLICDSEKFEVRDVRILDRDDAARVLIVMELADAAGRYDPKSPRITVGPGNDPAVSG
jgi:hypothetical protein